MFASLLNDYGSVISEGIKKETVLTSNSSIKKLLLDCRN